MAIAGSHFIVDRIDVSDLAKKMLPTRCVELRKQGFSYSEIARELGLSKSGVIQMLRRHGGLDDCKSHCPRGQSPYGYVRVRGTLMMHPLEIEIVGRILKFQNQGRSANSIAAVLNKKKISPRRGRNWDHSSVKNVLERYQGRLEEVEKFLKKGN